MMGIMEHNSYSGKLESQKKFFKNGHTIPVDARINALHSLSKSLKKHEENLLDALEKDIGKPRIESFLAEIYFLHQEINLISKKLRTWLKPQKAKNPFYFWPAKSWISREPYGVSLIFSPWNYPAQLAFSPLVAAIAAGNTVILKPSEITKNTEQVVANIIQDAFEKEWVDCILGGPDVSSELLNLDIDFVFFTGSTEIGKKVDSQLAGRLIPRALELGGKCPCIVNDTTCLKTTASRILTGKFFNAGQTCFAPDFIMVQESLKDELILELEKQLKERFPNDDLSDLAKLPTKNYAQRIINMRDEHSIIIGKDDGLKLSPTIQAIQASSPLLETEIFGPLLPVLNYQDQKELFSTLDKLSSPLALFLPYTYSHKKENSSIQSPPNSPLAQYVSMTP